MHQQYFAEEFVGSRIQNIPSRFKRQYAKKILEKPHRYPMTNSVIKANLYLDFRLLKFGQMSHDTLDDVKHLILASYADFFVSNDDKLHKYHQDINDRPIMLRLSEFMQSTSL